MADAAARAAGRVAIQANVYRRGGQCPLDGAQGDRIRGKVSAAGRRDLKAVGRSHRDVAGEVSARDGVALLGGGDTRLAREGVERTRRGGNGRIIRGLGCLCVCVADNPIGRHILEGDARVRGVDSHGARAAVVDLPHLRARARVTGGCPGGKVADAVLGDALIDVVVARDDKVCAPLGERPAHHSVAAVDTRRVRRYVEHDDLPGSLRGCQGALQPALLCCQVRRLSIPGAAVHHEEVHRLLDELVEQGGPVVINIVGGSIEIGRVVRNTGRVVMVAWNRPKGPGVDVVAASRCYGSWAIVRTNDTLIAGRIAGVDTLIVVAGRHDKLWVPTIYHVSDCSSDCVGRIAIVGDDRKNGRVLATLGGPHRLDRQTRNEGQNEHHGKDAVDEPRSLSGYGLG